MTDTPTVEPRACPWCSAPAAADARQCRSCGAAIAQREDLAGLQIPGVTGVDPNLLASPSSLSNPVLRTQGTTNALFAATQVDAGVGLAAAAAVLGQDFVKGLLSEGVDASKVGIPSEAALLAVERLEREDEAEAAPDPALDPWRDEHDRERPQP